MKLGESVYFFNTKRALEIGVLIRKADGYYIIKGQKRIYKRKLDQIGGVKNAEVKFSRLQNQDTGR